MPVLLEKNVFEHTIADYQPFLLSWQKKKHKDSLKTNILVKINYKKSLKKILNVKSPK